MNSNSQELGRILTALGVTNGEDLISRLHIDNYLGHLNGLELLAAGERQNMGEMLQGALRLTAPQVDGTRAEAEKNSKKLGEVLVERRLLTPQEAEVVLEFQRRLAEKAPNATKLRLGNVLVASRQITREELDAALHWQSAHGGRLGEALVAMGVLFKSQVKRYLRLQRKLVSAVLISALGICGHAFAAGTATGTLTVTTTVPNTCNAQVASANLVLPFDGAAPLSSDAQPPGADVPVSVNCTGGGMLLSITFDKGSNVSGSTANSPYRFMKNASADKLLGYKLYVNTNASPSASGGTNLNSLSAGASPQVSLNGSSATVYVKGRVFDDTGTWFSARSVAPGQYSDAVRMTVSYN